MSIPISKISDIKFILIPNVGNIQLSLNNFKIIGLKSLVLVQNISRKSLYNPVKEVLLNQRYYQTAGFQNIKKSLKSNYQLILNLKAFLKKRQEFLNMILLYFDLHLGSIRKPKSLQVLNQVFT